VRTRTPASAAIATLVWVPAGVWIGLDPKVSRLAQPVVQVLASFPANFLFPIITAALLATGLTLNWGGILLMSLGAQWYILFNVIAGASAIPNDLREAAANLRLPRALWWRRLVLPAKWAVGGAADRCVRRSRGDQLLRQHGRGEDAPGGPHPARLGDLWPIGADLPTSP
jgi:ABC-type anion transport system duplicated permease subunit